MHDALVSTRQLSKGLEGTIVLGTALVSFHPQYTPSPHIMISWKNTKPEKNENQKSKCTMITNLNNPNLNESTNSVIDQLVRAKLKPWTFQQLGSNWRLIKLHTLTPYTRYPWCRYRHWPFWTKMILMPLRFCSNFDPWVVNWSLRDLWIFFDLIRFTFSPLLLHYAQVEHLSSVYLFKPDLFRLRTWRKMHLGRNVYRWPQIDPACSRLESCSGLPDGREVGQDSRWECRNLYPLTTFC